MDPTRERIRAAAEGLLEERGIDGVQVREVAERAGTSTMGVYSRFGGKAGLLDALYRAGFARLRAAVEAEEGGDARAELVRMADAYRAQALAWPHHYHLMFGRGTPGYTPTEVARAEALAGFGVWRDAVRRATRAGVLAGPVTENALRLWALTHGLVGLELGELLPAAGARARRERHRAAFCAYLEGLAA